MVNPKKPKSSKEAHLKDNSNPPLCSALAALAHPATSAKRDKKCSVDSRALFFPEVEESP